MCFSVGASFTASGILGIVGFLAFAKAPPRYRLFASIPLLFAAQQFAEGIVWLVLTGIPEGSLLRVPLFIMMAPIGLLARASFKVPDHIILIKTGSIITFLVFALVVWPTWIPLACRRFETSRRRRFIITGFLLLGVIISTALLYGILAYGATAAIVQGHIVYTVNTMLTDISWLGVALYTLATVGPLMVSSLNYAYLLGGLIIISEIVAWRIWHISFVSTWCFFAAVLSIIILAILPAKNSNHA